MLGKGLESLIPPQNHSKHGSGQAQSDDDAASGVPAPQEPPEPPPHLTGHHMHDIDAGPAILSFDFTDSPREEEEDEPRVAPAVAEESVRGSLASEEEGGPEARYQPRTRASAVRDLPHSEPQDLLRGSDAPNSDGRFRIAEGQGPEARYSDAIFHIETAKIKPNPNQPRRNFNEDGIWELAKSIREFGFLQPLVATRARRSTEDGVDVEYELISGERRLLAAKKLGLEYVPAIIREVDLEREKLELAIIENIQREDLSPIERARAFQRLQEEFRLTQREIAAKLGKSRETVANTVRLLDLPLNIQEALERERITESHGRFLLQVGDPAAQKKLFDDILAQKLTTRDVKHRVQAAKPRKEKAPAAISPELKAVEERLTLELGTPVKIERSANTGKIVITFYSEEELQNIVERFGGLPDERI